MNVNRLRKAIEKEDVRTMARLALSAATDLPDDVAEGVRLKVGEAYLAAEDNEEPDVEHLRGYLRHVLFAEEIQQYYDKHGHPDGL